MKRPFAIIALLASVLLLPVVLRAQTADRPPAPSLNVNRDDSSIDVSWDAIEDAARYQLWVWTESDSWQQLDGGDLTATSFTHTGLAVGTTYAYTYRAAFAS